VRERPGVFRAADHVGAVDRAARRA
jgi:hypothetical protein